MEERAAEYGLFCHGNLNPWRILLRADGQVSVVGYGIPPIDILKYRDNKKRPPAEDTFRYCPPERLEDDPIEDLSSDLYLADPRFVYDTTPLLSCCSSSPASCWEIARV